MSDRWGMGLAALALPATLLIVAYGFLAINLGIPFAIPVGVVGSIAGAIALHGPVGKALARRLEGAPPPGAEPPSEQLLGELDDLRGRLAELEERVDFSERLLAQGRDEVRGAGRDPH